MKDKVFDFLINYFSSINDRGVDEMNNFRGDITSDEIVEWLKKVQNTNSEQPNEDLEIEIERFFNDDKWFSTPLGDIARHFANWQKEQSTKLLKTIYSDCDNLKKDLDRVTTGNLSHRIGNIKFSITGIQVIIKQAMEDEQ